MRPLHRVKGRRARKGGRRMVRAGEKKMVQQKRPWEKEKPNRAFVILSFSSGIGYGCGGRHSKDIPVTIQFPRGGWRPSIWKKDWECLHRGWGGFQTGQWMWRGNKGGGGGGVSHCRCLFLHARGHQRLTRMETRKHKLTRLFSFQSTLCLWCTTTLQHSWAKPIISSPGIGLPKFNLRRITNGKNITGQNLKSHKHLRS